VKAYSLQAALRAAVKGHVVKIRDIKATKSRTKSSSHPNREQDIWALEGYRRDFRHEGRVLHLAYNLVKGTPYEKVERETDNKVYPVQEIVNLIGGSENDVRKWLGIPAKELRRAS